MLRQYRKLDALASACRTHQGAFASIKSAANVFSLESKAPLAACSFSTQPDSTWFNVAASPHSLEFERFPTSPEAQNPGILKSMLLKVGGYYSKESRLMRAAEGLYDCVKEAADTPQFFKFFDIPTDFQHQHAVLSLHVWLLLVRLRPEGKEGKDLAQVLYDNFQDDLEMRVRSAGVKVKVRGQLSELEKQFYGSCMAYDKALKKESSETFGDALFRNVYQKKEGKEAAAGKLERYLRRELACLAQTDSKDVMTGNVRFSFASSSV